MRCKKSIHHMCVLNLYCCTPVILGHIIQSSSTTDNREIILKFDIKMSNNDNIYILYIQ